MAVSRILCKMISTYLLLYDQRSNDEGFLIRDRSKASQMEKDQKGSRLYVVQAINGYCQDKYCLNVDKRKCVWTVLEDYE